MFLFVRPPCLPTPQPTTPSTKITPTCRRPLKHSNRRKGPAPVSIRPKTELPPLPRIPFRHQKLAHPPLDSSTIPSARSVFKSLSARRDVIIHTTTFHDPGALSTVLASRERDEHTLVIATTRDTTLIAAHEARLVEKGKKKETPVIVAAGTNVPGGWQHPAMNANSRNYAVIVVASVRSCLHDFLLNQHGRKYLEKVKFLIIVDAVGVVEIGAERHLGRILKAMVATVKRKNVVMIRECTEKPNKVKLDKLVGMLVREKNDHVKWNALQEKEESETKNEEEKELEREKKKERKKNRGKNFSETLTLKLSGVDGDNLDEKTACLGDLKQSIFSTLDVFLNDSEEKREKRLKKTDDDESTFNILSIPEELQDDGVQQIKTSNDEMQEHFDNEGIFISSEEKHDDKFVDDVDTFSSDQVEAPTIDKLLPVSTTTKPPSSQMSEGQLERNVPLSHTAATITNTNEQAIKSVTQKIIIGNWNRCYNILRTLLKQSSTSVNNEHRTLVIFPTGRLAECYATMARADGIELHDVHRRSSPAKRERALEWLHMHGRGILFTTDVVTSEHVLLPHVHRVIQFGLPHLKKEYISRVAICTGGDNDVHSNGDTEALLMVGEREAELMNEILGLEEMKVTKMSVVEMETELGIKNDAEVTSMEWKGDGLDMKAKAKAYLSWVSFWRLKRRTFGWVNRQVVDLVNEWAVQTFGEVPSVPSNIAKKMQIRHLSNIAVEVVQPPPPKIRLKKKKKKKKNVELKIDVNSKVNGMESNDDAASETKTEKKGEIKYLSRFETMINAATKDPWK